MKAENCTGQIAFATDKGLRENLEDAAGAFRMTAFIPRERELTLAVVADGVGGEAGGEIASRMAVNRISSFVAASLSSGLTAPAATLSSESVVDVLVRGFETANEAIVAAAAREPGLGGMATTTVCALVLGNVLYVASVGDSRCYLCDRGRIEQLTHDHTGAQSLVDLGLVDPQAVKHHPLAHAVNRFLGNPKGVEVETWTRALSTGDIVLLCTDGLTDVLADKEISAVLADCGKGNRSLKCVAQELTDRALAAGTTDNITVLCYAHRLPEFECPGSDVTFTGAYPAELARVFSKPLLERTCHE